MFQKFFNAIIASGCVFVADLHDEHFILRMHACGATKPRIILNGKLEASSIYLNTLEID